VLGLRAGVLLGPQDPRRDGAPAGAEGAVRLRLGSRQLRGPREGGSAVCTATAVY